MSACKLACMDKLSALSTKKKPLNLFKPLTRDFMNEMSENCPNYNYSFIMVIIVSTSTFNTPFPCCTSKRHLQKRLAKGNFALTSAAIKIHVPTEGSAHTYVM